MVGRCDDGATLIPYEMRQLGQRGFKLETHSGLLLMIEAKLPGSTGILGTDSPLKLALGF